MQFSTADTTSLHTARHSRSHMAVENLQRATLASLRKDVVTVQPEPQSAKVARKRAGGCLDESDVLPLSKRECQKSEIPHISIEMDKLESLIFQEDRKRLEEVAADDKTYEPIWKTMQSLGFQSARYRVPHTCDTLYWAWKKGYMTDTEYLERHNYLSLSLLLLTNYFFDGWDKPLAKSLDIEPVAAGTERNGLADAQYKVTMNPYSEDIRACLMTPFTSEEGDHEWDTEQKVRFALKWLIFLRGKAVGIKMNGRTGDIKSMLIKSITATAKSFKVKDSPVHLRPTFGFGGWDELKAFREVDTHPIALWHYSMPYLEVPDNRWAGSLCSYHDMYHAKLLNNLSKPVRDEALEIDDKCVAFAIDVLESIVGYYCSDPKITLDACDGAGFLVALKDYYEGLLEVDKALKNVDNINIGNCDQYKSLAVDRLAADISYFQRRYFLDQEYRSDERVTRDYMKCFRRPLHPSTDNFGRWIASHYILVALIHQKKIPMLEKMFGVDWEACIKQLDSTALPKHSGFFRVRLRTTMTILGEVKSERNLPASPITEEGVSIDLIYWIKFFIENGDENVQSFLNSEVLRVRTTNNSEIQREVAENLCA